MANEQAAKKPAAAAAAPPVIDTSDWNEGNVNVDAWYAPEISGKIIGRCIEAIRIVTAFGDQDVVKVRLGQRAKAITGKGEESETIELDTGMVIAVRVSTNLGILLELVQNQCAVEITPTGKVKTKRGQMWKYGVKFKGIRAPLASQPRTQETPSGSGAPQDDDELPF